MFSVAAGNAFNWATDEESTSFIFTNRYIAGLLDILCTSLHLTTVFIFANTAILDITDLGVLL